MQVLFNTATVTPVGRRAEFKTAALRAKTYKAEEAEDYNGVEFNRHHLGVHRRSGRPACSSSYIRHDRSRAGTRPLLRQSDKIGGQHDL